MSRNSTAKAAKGASQTKPANERYDVISVFRQFDLGKISIEEAERRLEQRRRSQSSRFGRLLDALVS